MVLFELGGRANVHDFVKFVQLCYGRDAFFIMFSLQNASNRGMACGPHAGMDAIKLTQFSHGGGCGCKIAPSILAELLSRAPAGIVPAALMVGTETADDAAV